MILYGMVAVMTFLGALGAFFFKQGAERLTGIASLFTTPKIYLGGGFYAAAALLNIALLKHFDYSVLYPMTAATYVWSLLLSHWLLKEPVTGRKIAGICVIGVGLLFLSGG